MSCAASDPEEKQRLEFAGILMRQNLKVIQTLAFIHCGADMSWVQAATQAFHTYLRQEGLSQESIDDLTGKANNGELLSNICT
jgi:hypothetical protein